MPDKKKDKDEEKKYPEPDQDIQTKVYDAEFRQKYIEEDYSDIMKVMVSTLSDMTDKNRTLVMNKGIGYKTMLWLICGGILLFVIGFVALAAN